MAGTKRRLENGAAPEAKRPTPANSARETVFRLLASSRKIGSIIGRGGEIIKQLKAETGARMKVADAVPNCDERVVIISSAPDPSVQWNSAQVCSDSLTAHYNFLARAYGSSMSWQAFTIINLSYVTFAALSTCSRHISSAQCESAGHILHQGPICQPNLAMSHTVFCLAMLMVSIDQRHVNMDKSQKVQLDPCCHAACCL